ncbi:hypothetical protein Salat_2069800 [Sesamum alatum]|uniref:Secreted protein n=1 Tax=Sesamum alatum TaxID=300844 RepID=A0AAE1Y009_9LAMI|nr:hypothetical protein Salat_2069800 [Sesamum alatum]
MFTTLLSGQLLGAALVFALGDGEWCTSPFSRFPLGTSETLAFLDSFMRMNLSTLFGSSSQLAAAEGGGYGPLGRLLGSPGGRDFPSGSSRHLVSLVGVDRLFLVITFVCGDSRLEFDRYAFQGESPVGPQAPSPNGNRGLVLLVGVSPLISSINLRAALAPFSAASSSRLFISSIAW